VKNQTHAFGLKIQHRFYDDVGGKERLGSVWKHASALFT